jgi:hypothetical protein
MLKISLHKPLLLKLLLGVILLTVTGTLTHEFGHYIVARMLGYKAEIKYGMTTFYDAHNDSFLQHIHTNYAKEVKHKLPFPASNKYWHLQAQQRKNTFWILFGGVAQTTLFGSLGLLLLLLHKAKIQPHQNNIPVMLWMYIFMALFWLREPVNLLAGLGKLIYTGVPPMFDEISLAHLLNWPSWSIAVLTGLLGMFIFGYILFRIIPAALRFTFFTAVFLGGCLGYILWLMLLGPIILP